MPNSPKNQGANGYVCFFPLTKTRKAPISQQMDITLTHCNLKVLFQWSCCESSIMGLLKAYLMKGRRVPDGIREISAADWLLTGGGRGNITCVHIVVVSYYNKS